MIWIVGGPSSAGKSTFIRSDRFAALTGLPATTPVIWPRQRELLAQLGDADAIYHYNLLSRQFYNQRSARQARRRGDAIPPVISGFDDDPDWINVISQSQPMRAVVLVTSKATILDRMMERTHIEDQGLTGREQKTFKTQMWRDIVQEVDLPTLYEDWCRTLRAHGVPYILVAGEDASFRVITEGTLANLAGREADHVGSGQLDGRGPAAAAPTPAEADRERRREERRAQRRQERWRQQVDQAP